jgi:hypothetical protein
VGSMLGLRTMHSGMVVGTLIGTKVVVKFCFVELGIDFGFAGGSGFVGFLVGLS